MTSHEQLQDEIKQLRQEVEQKIEDVRLQMVEIHTKTLQNPKLSNDELLNTLRKVLSIVDLHVDVDDFRPHQMIDSEMMYEARTRNTPIPTFKLDNYFKNVLKFHSDSWSHSVIIEWLCDPEPLRRTTEREWSNWT